LAKEGKVIYSQTPKQIVRHKFRWHLRQLVEDLNSGRQQSVVSQQPVRIAGHVSLKEMTVIRV
jgi:hypothetical protein